MEKISYQDILKKELVRRCNVNPKYSLRAFARDLSLSPGQLSDVLKGKLGLSHKSALKVCNRLSYVGSEKDLFINLVLAQDARSKAKRQSSQSLLASIGGRLSEYKTVDPEKFRLVADWYHFAIIDLIQTADFKSDPKWISSRLGISLHETKVAVERLIKLGLIKEIKGKLKNVPTPVATTTDVPSEAIKEYHQQILEKARKAVVLQNISERDFSAISIAFSPEDILEMKKKIREFRRSLHAWAESRNTKKSEVYNMSIQFFRLTEPNKGGI